MKGQTNHNKTSVGQDANKCLLSCGDYLGLHGTSVPTPFPRGDDDVGLLRPWLVGSFHCTPDSALNPQIF